jgi:hypothetical protein
LVLRVLGFAPRGRSAGLWNTSARAKRELRRASGGRREVIRRRIEATATRIGVITEHRQILAHAEAERRKREHQAEEAVS